MGPKLEPSLASFPEDLEIPHPVPMLPHPQEYFHSYFLKKCFLVKLEYAMRRWSFVAEI